MGQRGAAQEGPKAGAGKGKGRVHTHKAIIQFCANLILIRITLHPDHERLGHAMTEIVSLSKSIAQRGSGQYFRGNLNSMGMNSLI
jgi:hypothetical protein